MKFRDLAKEGVTRRSFMQLASGLIATIPGMMVYPVTALAEEDDWSESLEQDAGSAGTSVIKVVKLKANEVGVQVADMSTRAETVVEGAYVRIVSSENDKVVEGYTDEYGMLTLDITELARCDEGEDRTKLSEYRFYGSIEVDPGSDGFRKFATGLMRFTGGVAHIIPTRSRENQMYPLKACFDEWDVLYTDNDFIATSRNSETHAFTIVLCGLAAQETTVALRVQAKSERRPRQTVRVVPVDGVANVKFEGKFLQEGHDDYLPIGCKVVLDVTQGGVTKCINLHFGVAEGVVEESGYGEDNEFKPFSLGSVNTALDIKLPSFLPLIGGGSITEAWTPSFPVNVSINPFGSFQLTVKPGYNRQKGADGKYDTDKHSGFPSMWGYKYTNNPATDGWHSWPVNDAKDSFNGFNKRIAAAYNGVESVWSRDDGSNMFGHGKLFPNVKCMGGLQLVAGATYDWDSGLFRGSVGAQVMVNLEASVAEQFVAFGIPFIISIGVKGSFLVFLGCGMYSKKARTGSKVDFMKALLSFSNWHFDYTDTGLTITVSVSPFFSLGVGIRGAASVSLQAKCTLTIYLGFTYRGELDTKTHPCPQVIVSGGAEITVILQIWLVTKSWEIVGTGYKELYNRWKKAKGSAQADLEGQGLNPLADRPMSELVESMNVVTDAMLKSTVEATGKKNLSAQADPEGWGPVREDDIVGVLDNGTPITYKVIRIADTEARDEEWLARNGGQRVEGEQPSDEKAAEGQAPDGQQGDAQSAGSSSNAESQSTAGAAETEVPADAARPDGQSESVEPPADAQGEGAPGDTAADAAQDAVAGKQEVAPEASASNLAAQADGDAKAEGNSEGGGSVLDAVAGLVAAVTGGPVQEESPAIEEPEGNAPEAVQPAADAPSAEALAAQADQPEEKAEPATQEQTAAQTGDSQDAQTAAPRRRIRHTRSVTYDLTRGQGEGLAAMADSGLPEPEIAGLGREGGVRPSSDKKLAENVFGDPKVKVINVPISDNRGSGNLTCAFRLATVMIGDVARTRIFMEILSVKGYPLEAFQTRQMLDFDVTDEEGKPIPGFESHDSLYDYDFDVTWTSTRVPPELGGKDGDYWHYVHFIILSGKRAQGDATSVYSIANDLLLTYLSVSINDLVNYHLGDRASFAQYSAPANRFVEDGGEFPFHSIFSLSCLRVPDEDSRYLLVCYLDRRSKTQEGVLSDQDGAVHVGGGFFVIDIKTGMAMVPDMPAIENEMGYDSDMPTSYELKLLPKIGGYYGLTLRSVWKSYYYALGIDESTGLFTSVAYAGSADAQFLPWPKMDCFLAQWATEEEVGDDRRREGGELRKVWWQKGADGKVVGIESERIGPENFGVRKFGVNANGGFIFWPQGREGEDAGLYSSQFNEDGTDVNHEYVKNEEADVPCYQIMAMRIRERDGELVFSEPFVAADVEHRMRDLIVVQTQEERSPLEVLSIDLVEPTQTDAEGMPIYHAANLWYTAVPNLKCAVVLTNVPIRAGVFAGSTGSFRVTIKNYGNCYLSGCTVQMCLHKVTDIDDGEKVLSEEFSKVEGSTMELVFGEDTLLESSWNPEDDNGNLLNVEPDYSLAPGQIAEYRVEVPIPNDWQSGNYSVSFWAYAPTMAVGGGLSAAAEEGANFVDFVADPGIGAKYVRPTSFDGNPDAVDLTTLIVNDAPDGTDLNDAPVQSPEDAARDAGVDDNGNGSGNNNGNAGNSNGNSGGASGTSRPVTSSTTTTKTTTPKTGDATSAALPAALAGLGAAALAYERRRARNERQSRGEN